MQTSPSCDRTRRRAAFSACTAALGEDRMNVEVDKADQIARVYCG
jgi:hypothetical protein